MTQPVLLYGTPVAVPPRRFLRAGPLSAEFDSGSLRWIRWNGTEILRAIMFLVRTPGWGTPDPALKNLTIEEAGDGFAVSYEAHYGTPGAGVTVAISFEGKASGSLSAKALIRAEVPFETNRTGFVILHPLDGFAGTEVEVEHASAPARKLVIPAQISPGQPVMDMRAITHFPRPGLRVATRFEGDIFEMEDHRNWSDASFKTYSRPIGLPYPYLLDPAEPQVQEVNVSISDDGGEAEVAPAVTVPAIMGQRLPDYALPLDRLADADLALSHIELLRPIAPQRLLLRLDLTRETAIGFAPLAQLKAQLGADLEITLILASGNDADAKGEVARVADLLRAASLEISAISAFAKIDEQSFQPGEPRPPHPSEPSIAEALRQYFPRSAIGGGTPAFFTELNRNRPDPALADYLTFAGTPMVHAADDASVMETLQSLPHILASATALAGGKPLALGPVGIGARLNPYGAAPNDNAPDAREGMPSRDPRQRGLFAAAWTVGYLARIAPFAPNRLAFGGVSGGFGLLSLPQDYPRAFWDELPEASAYPLYLVAGWIASAAGAQLISAETQGGIASLTWKKDGQTAALIASLGEEDRPLTLPDWAKAGRLLSAETLRDAALAPAEFLRPTALPPIPTLPAFAVLYLTDGEPA